MGHEVGTEFHVVTVVGAELRENVRDSGFGVVRSGVASVFARFHDEGGEHSFEGLGIQFLVAVHVVEMEH